MKPRESTHSIWQFAAAVLLAAVCFPMFAATYDGDWASLRDARAERVKLGPVVAFADTYSFLFPVTATTGLAPTFDFSPGRAHGIDDFRVALYTGSGIFVTDGNDGGAAEGSQGPHNGDGVEASAAGTHDAPQASGISAPEPESYAMFLAGLGAIGFIAARRRITS